jgi:hypothetical protein
VNGEQKSSERKQLIRSFRNAAKALVTNARCLTEGIDVPAVDMVAFIDPRHSRIDIAQATGRAMRKPHGLDKDVGYVVIPLFLERRSGETLEEALERSDFADVADVLNAMQEQDEDLVQIIREIQEAKGRGEIFDPQKLSEKVEVLGPSIELAILQSNIFVEIADALGVSWDEMYGRLAAYKKLHGDCNVPREYSDKKLANWIVTQRVWRNDMRLSAERIERLERLGFVWDPRQVSWEIAFRQLSIYKEVVGHCHVPRGYIQNGLDLGNWANNQRARKDSIRVENRRRLDEIGFIWDPLEADWQQGFFHLTTYKNREGHCRVPDDHIENGFRLGTWVGNQRRAKDKLSKHRLQRLEEIGFVWNPHEDAWEKGFKILVGYKQLEGHCRVPWGHNENGFPLGIWVSNQRKNEDLSQERRQRLDEIGFVWDPFAEAWEKGFNYLVAYREREGHCRVPRGYIEDGFDLGRWVGKQRAVKNLSKERRQQLDELGFVWDPREALWEEGFSHLVTYKEREGDCRVPQRDIENGFPLGTWASNQRAKKETMSVNRRQRLNDLGFVWREQRKAAADASLSPQELDG